jgi:hypothetical protein
MKTTWIALLAGGVLMRSFAFADANNFQIPPDYKAVASPMDHK